MKEPLSMECLPAKLAPLPAAAFVESAIEALGLTNMRPADAHALTQSILRGTSKSQVWASLFARASGRPSPPPVGLPSALVRPDDDICILEVLTDHAPDNDTTFIEYVYFRLAARSPELHERLRLQRELASGEISRTGAVRTILRLAQSEGRTPVLAALRSDTPFSIISGDRDERLLLLKRLSGTEYAVSENSLSGNAAFTDQGLAASEGLIFAGPKRPLRPGQWHLAIDWKQPDSVTTAIEVTVNGGMEKLTSIRFAGNALLRAEFRVLPEHLVTEVLVFISNRTSHSSDVVHLQPDELSLVWKGA